MRLNRRASEIDLIYLGVIVFVVGFVAIFGYYLVTIFEAPLIAKGAPAFAFDHAKNAIGMFNYGIIFITIGFGIAAFISAMMVRSHPVFFVASILGLVVMLFILSVTSNIFDKLMVTGPFSTLATTTFSQLFAWVRNLPTIMVSIWAIMAIGLYAKWSRGRV